MTAIVVAASENNVIGREGGMPWHLPRDMKFFKSLTTGHPVIMGRKTFESLGKPLPNRTNIVITRNENYTAEGCAVVSNIEEAIQRAQTTDETIFIIGGGEIYRQALSLCDRVYLTRVSVSVDGDTYFPRLDEKKWKLTAEEVYEKDEKNAYNLSFLTYEKIRD
jgi:dihydrofolate reductase